jgi:hypothetical protein
MASNSKAPFLETLDTSVFTILTALSENDRQSFMRIQRAVRNKVGAYSYLEIGSEMGGSLIPHLLDPLCVTSMSIDLRPKSMPDERGTFFHYPDNSTEKMLRTLGEHIGDEPLAKLKTFDSDVSKIPASALPAKPHLAMIDGEHTNVACFSDFVNLFSLVESNSIIAFHDSNLVADAILNCEKMLAYLQIPFETVFLADCVAAIGLRDMAEIVRTELSPHALNREEYLIRSRNGRWYAVANSMLEAGYFKHLQDAVQQATRQLEAQNAQHQNAHAEVQAMVRQRDEQLQESERSLAETRAALQRAESQAASYESSTSWRVTKPMRTLRTLFLRSK